MNPQTPAGGKNLKFSILQQSGARQAFKAFFFEQEGGRRRARKAVINVCKRKGAESPWG